MKKSNKISVIYVCCSLLLLGALLFGGVYGIYVSVGLSFMRSSVSNVTEGVQNMGVNNVSYGGSVNFSSSMVGVIILSIVLIVLAILDMISLIRQIVFFKQFKPVRESKIEKTIEKKIKSKTAVIVFVCVVDILSIIVGVVGIFINARSFSGNNVSWVLYVVDGLIAVLSLTSLVLLFVKLKKLKNDNVKQCENNELTKIKYEPVGVSVMNGNKQKFDIDEVNDIEIMLLKLKYLKLARLISNEEYIDFRNKILPKEKEVSIVEKVEEKKN